MWKSGARTFDGKDVDLIPFILTNRERLVLKPNDDYGGRGIVLGWTVDDSGLGRRAANLRWQAATSCRSGSPSPAEPYPSLVDGKVVFTDRMFDTAPFCFHGEFMASCLTRLSTLHCSMSRRGAAPRCPHS